MSSTLLAISDRLNKANMSREQSPPLGIAASFVGVQDDPVILTAGVVNLAAAAGASIADAAVIAGLDTLVPTGTAAATVVNIYKYDAETVIELPFATSTGGSVTAPVTDGGTTAQRQALIGNSYGISRNTAGTYYLNKALTGSSACATIVALGTRYPTADAFITMLVTIIPANRMA